ncbi:MAG TPA: AAA family ATPase [Thermoguttaceae bacterium]|nr:AAA family ATPase [Thermoguttaceae bacterium]
MSSSENFPFPDDMPEAPWAEATPRSRAGTIGFSAFLHALRRHWVLATAIGVACALVAGPAVWLAVGPTYMASAYLQISEQPQYIIAEGPRSPRDAFEIYINTQEQILTSPLVLTAALRAFPDQDGKLIEPEKFSMLAGEVDKIRWLADELVVRFPGQAEIMEVSLTDDNKEEATLLVNAVVDAYMAEVVDAEGRQKRQRLTEIQTAHGQKTIDVRRERAQLESLARVLGTADEEARALRQRIAIQEWADFQRQLAQTMFTLRQATGALAAQGALLASIQDRPITKPELDRYLNQDVYARQVATELAYHNMNQQYTQGILAPGTKSRQGMQRFQDQARVSMQYAELERNMAAEVRAMMAVEIQEERNRLQYEVDSLTGQKTQLEAEVAQKKAIAEDLGQVDIEYQMKLADIADIEASLRRLAEEREKIAVELDSPSRIRQRGRAEVPKSEANFVPRVGLTTFAMLLGLVFPAGGIGWWDMRKGRINSAEDVRRQGIDVIGSVPMIPARIARQMGTPSKRGQTWMMRLTESVDSIVARLLRTAELEQRRVILITSPSGGEGKTTLATRLATSLAHNGRRTVLVDFDLRRPAVDGVFGLSSEPGVCEILRRQSDLEAALQKTGVENLSAVTAGRWQRDVTMNALANGGAGPILDGLREQFEFVIIDAGPVLPVADTRFVSQHVDAAILSVFRDVSEAPKIESAREILEAFGVGTVEAVVTGPTDTLRESTVEDESEQPAQQPAA